MHGQLTHVVYTAQGKELMLLAVPHNRLVILQVHKALLLDLLFCMGEVWSVTLKEEHKLGVTVICDNTIIAHVA